MIFSSLERFFCFVLKKIQLIPILNTDSLGNDMESTHPNTLPSLTFTVSCHFVSNAVSMCENFAIFSKAYISLSSLKSTIIYDSLKKTFIYF